MLQKIIFLAILALSVSFSISAQEPQVFEVYNKGNDEFRKGNLDSAIQFFTEAIKLDGEFVGAYISRGNAYLRKRQFDTAISDYSKALALKPASVGVYINLSSAYSGKKDFERALEYLKKGEEIDPKFPYVYSSRANIYSQMKEYQKAVESYTKAIEIKPLSGFYTGRCFANYNFEKYDEAIADCSEAMTRNPKDSWAYYYRGLVRLKLTQNALAISDLRKALEINPQFASAKTKLEDLLKDNKY